MDSFSNDVILCIASYLRSNELLNLALTCRRFGAKNTTHQDNLSLMEEAALQYTMEQTEAERETLSRFNIQSCLELYHELQRLRSPLIFDRLIGQNIEYVDEGYSEMALLRYQLRFGREIYREDKKKMCIWCASTETNTAISNKRMRGGKHCVTFTKHGYGRMNVGIIRPMKVEGEDEILWFDPLERRCWDNMKQCRTNHEWEANTVNCCMYNSFSGSCCWSDCTTNTTYDTWTGMDTLQGEGAISLELDLDEGTLTVHKDSVRLGVIKTSGLSGEFCWIASICWDNIFDSIANDASTLCLCASQYLVALYHLRDICLSSNYVPC